MRLAASFVKACIARSEELDIPIANGVCFEELMDVLVRAVDRRHEAGQLVRAVDSRCEADSRREAGKLAERRTADIVGTTVRKRSQPGPVSKCRKTSTVSALNSMMLRQY